MWSKVVILVLFLLGGPHCSSGTNAGSKKESEISKGIRSRRQNIVESNPGSQTASTNLGFAAIPSKMVGILDSADSWSPQRKAITLAGLGISAITMYRLRHVEWGSKFYKGILDKVRMSVLSDNLFREDPLIAFGLTKDIGSFEGTLSQKDMSLLKVRRMSESAPITTAHFNPESRFDRDYFFSLLNSRSIGRIVIYASSVDSTQTTLFDTLDTEHNGVLCLADRQSGGRGRGGNKWISPAGCLLFSFNSALDSAARLPFYQYLVSMAVYRAVSRLVGGDAKAKIGLQLKWPNDIYGRGGVKIGGVLCQSSVSRQPPPPAGPSAVGETGRAGGGYYVCAGVGLNVLNELPTKCLRGLMREAGLEEAAGRVSREGVLAAFCEEMEAVEDQFNLEGFAPRLAGEYKRMWMHSNQRVKVKPEDGKGETKQVTIVGVAPSGFLLAEDEFIRRQVSFPTLKSGQVGNKSGCHKQGGYWAEKGRESHVGRQGAKLELHPDGNSLDMMQGLLYPKRRT